MSAWQDLMGHPPQNEREEQQSTIYDMGYCRGQSEMSMQQAKEAVAKLHAILGTED